MAESHVSIGAYIRLVRGNRNFRYLWLAQIVSEIGDWLYAVAIYSLLLDLTGKAQSVAIAVVLQVLPQVLIAPLAGVINDRMRRRMVMINTDLVRAVIVLGMLAASHMGNVWAIYAMLLLETTMWGFFEPARHGILPNVTSSHMELLVANALASTTWSFNLAVGSALGGALAWLFGRDAVFVINAGTFLLSAWFLTRMAVTEKHAEEALPLRWKDLADFSPVIEGLRYVRSDARRFATLLLKGGLGLMGGHYVVLPVFGERVFPVHLGEVDAQRAGMLGMSLLMGARGVGALIGPLVSGYWAGRRQLRMRRGILAGFFCITAGYGLLSVAPHIGIAALFIILAHAGASTIWVFSTTMLQLQTEDRLRGRVFSAEFACLVTGIALSTHLCGLAVDRGIAVQTVSLGLGLVALLPAALWGIFAMPLWRGEKDTEIH
jgi:MFS family permease